MTFSVAVGSVLIPRGKPNVSLMENTTETWDSIAEAWDASVGEGSDFQKSLVFPATTRLLAPAAGMQVLDACCGNGNYSRRLVELACRVTAFDGSSRMVELARGRTHPELPIRFEVADATDEGAILAAAGSEPYDAVVCSMALMDLPVIDPFLRAARKVLKPGGRLVWSIGHPAFHTNEAAKFALQEEGDAPVQRFGCLVTRYAEDYPHPSRGLITQPVPHTIYHRSMQTLFAACFAAGFRITGLEEPVFGPDPRTRSPFSWARRPDIPPVLVVRCE